jgi:hypothetical protein
MQTKLLTITEFAELNNWDYIVASNVMKVLVEIGDAKESGKRPNPPGQKGKPAVLYEVNRVVSMRFWDDAEDKEWPDAPPAENKELQIDENAVLA